jgi:hypothetical protein
MMEKDGIDNIYFHRLGLSSTIGQRGVLSRSYVANNLKVPDIRIRPSHHSPSRSETNTIEEAFLIFYYPNLTITASST